MRMNVKRKFTCKLEDLIAIAGYLIQRLRADLATFADFSETFSEEFIEDLNALTKQCSQLVASETLTQEIEEVSNQIKLKIKQLRLDVNKMEVYLEMADGEMTVNATSLGLKEVRANIQKANSEGIVKQTRQLMAGVATNLTVLQTKGLKPALVAEINQLADEIETLGNDQNFKTTERNRHTDENNGTYNQLWDKITLITDTGKALYRGVDATKLDDYTLASILNRIGGSKGSKPATPPTPPVV